MTGLFSRIRSALRRTDARIEALALRSACKDAVRRAKVRGDTRAQHHAERALFEAETNLLRLEASQCAR